ncbi:MAG TPA: hypothetical protein DD670_09970 [Planctomycetaceae bacterium]|nr:hypothetical protein [Planctomycetaceae bacterium]
MSDEKPAKSSGGLAPLILTAMHGILWFVLLGMLLKIVAGFEGIFADFGMELPLATIWAIGLANLAFRFWYLAMLLIAGLCAVDLALLRVLFARPKLAFLAWLWATAMFVVPLALMAWIVVWLWIPLVHLIHDLS